MKGVFFLIVILLAMVSNASCGEISATISKDGNNTIISCSPLGEGEIEKAYLSIYASDDQSPSLNRRELDVSYENKATFELPGTHDVLEGKCKFIMAGNKRILREEFLVSMK